MQQSGKEKRSMKISSEREAERKRKKQKKTNTQTFQSLFSLLCCIDQLLCLLVLQTCVVRLLVERLNLRGETLLFAERFVFGLFERLFHRRVFGLQLKRGEGGRGGGRKKERGRGNEKIRR